MKIWFLIIFPLLLFCEKTEAQQHISFQHFGVGEGLSASDVTTFFQDSRGYMWIGTANGLNRGNGRNFKIFRAAGDSTKNSLPNHKIRSIFEDKNKMIWIGTSAGLSKYDPQLEKFTNFTKVGDCKNCLAGRMVKIIQEDGNYLWLGTNAGLSKINIKTAEITSWWHKEGRKNIPLIYGINDILLQENGSLLLATDEGLVVFNPQKDIFKGIPIPLEMREKGLMSLFRDTFGNIWIGTYNDGVIKMNGSMENPKFEFLPQLIPTETKTTVYDFAEDHFGRLWISSYLGLAILDPKTKKVRYFTSEPDNPESISQNPIQHLFKDAQNRIWLGSTAGIDLYDPYLTQFEILKHSKNNTQTISSDNTFSILEDSKGYMWIGFMNSGITVLWRDENGVENFHHITEGKGNQQLRSNAIYALEEDKTGRIWASSPGGLHIINWPDRSNFNYTISMVPEGPISENKLPENRIYQIKNDANNKTWLATHSAGVIAFDANGKANQFKYEDQNPEFASKDFVVTLEIDPKDRIWTGNINLGGAIIKNPSTENSFKRIKGDKPFYMKVVNNYHFSGNEALLTTEAGVFHFPNAEDLLTSENPSHTKYTVENGLSSNFTSKIIKTKENEYWISSDNGLTKINTAEKKATPYRKIMNARDFQFNHNAGTLTRDSIIYFGGTHGIVRFKPSEIYKNPFPPQVVLTDFRILNIPVLISEKKTSKTTLPKNIAYVDKVTLKPSDKIISFTIDAINFTLPQETNYAYKLDGFDEDWIESGSPLITRSNLDPGNYSLLVKASNNDGVWSEPVRLQLEMLPPWYRTWWAYILYVLFACGTIYVLMKLRLQQERRLELARAQERDIFRKRSSRDFHDEAGTRITRIALITELAKMNSEENPEMLEYLSQIDINLQELNSGMRDFIWALDPNQDNAFDTLSRFVEFAGKFCEYGNIQFKSENISENLKKKELNMAERRHLLLILKEAINNSIKHGKPTVINFKIDSKPGMLKLVLEDNGSGFNNENIARGNGLKNMKERAKALGGALKIKSETNGGTKLTLILETTRLGN